MPRPSNPIPRRRLLSLGGQGMLGLTLGHWARAQDVAPARLEAAKAKSVIFCYQFGGPSHLDLFDPKPNAPAEIRGPHGWIDTTAPEIRVCEHLPNLARWMDKITLVRSMTHTMKNHNSASYYALTGHAPPLDDIRLRDTLDLFPAYGSVMDALAPSAPDLPTFAAFPHVIRDGAITPGQHASFLGKSHDPFLVLADPNRSDFRLPELNLPAGLSFERLEQRRELQRLIDDQAPALSGASAGAEKYYRKAVEMLASPRVAEAFDLSREPDAVRDRYGRETYGQSLLLARRLVEAGVRFVNVYFSDNIGGQTTTGGGWDTHGFNNTRMFPIIKERHLPITDRTLPALLSDLSDLGLLGQTLVVWMGEFGRTPRINDNASRDHWPQCYTALLAGGGTRGGYVYGASDRFGAVPARDPVRPDDLAATMFHLLGIDPATEIHDTAGRPLPISAGTPIFEVMA